MPPVNIDNPIYDKYVARGGWAVVGSSAMLSSWTPGRSAATMCGSGAVSGWYQCNFTDVNGVSRPGRIQTFKGAGSGSGEHAIFKGTSLNAVFMSRGLLGPLTRIYTTGKDGFYLLGYPTGDSYSIAGGTKVRMDFQNGWGEYTISGCGSVFYYWQAIPGQYVTYDPVNYCD